MRSKKTPITPLTIIDVEDYEELLADIAAHSFDELLDSYYRAHMRGVHDQFVRFRRINIPYLRDKAQPVDFVEAKFGEFFAALGPRVFKEFPTPSE